MGILIKSLAAFLSQYPFLNHGVEIIGSSLQLIEIGIILSKHSPQKSGLLLQLTRNRIDLLVWFIGTLFYRA